MNTLDLFGFAGSPVVPKIPAAPKRELPNQLATWAETLEAGRVWLFTDTSKKPELRQALPAIATSDVADVWLIGAWNSYHGTGRIDYIRRTRGNRWVIGTTRGEKCIVSIVDPFDHRDGVKVEVWF